MIRSRSRGVVVASTVIALLTVAFACHVPRQTAPANAAAGAADAEMMAKWTAFMTPGREHRFLDAKVGKWSLDVTTGMPGGPVTKATGTCEMKWIMGGRYLADETHGTMMGAPFEGMGLTGYDNLKQKYVGTWVDTMGTGIQLAEGAYDAATKTLAFSCESPDVMAGKYRPSRTVETFLDANTWKMEMIQTGPDGREYKSMEIMYTRLK